MAQIRIVTDSTAEIPAATARRLGITVVPMELHLDGRVWRDGVDLTPEDLFDQLAAKPQVTTMAPSVQALQATYASLSSTTDQILSVHISSKLSKTVDNARQAASAFLGRTQIFVLDSQLASFGQGLLAIAAAEAALRGSSLNEIVRLLRGMIAHIYIVFFAESLDYLEKSARIDRSQAVLGSMLNIKPLLILEEGEIMPLEKVRTRGKALDRLHEFVIEFTHFEKLTIVHGKRIGESQDLLERIAQTFPDREILISTYSPALATHLGPEAMGVIVYEGL